MANGNFGGGDGTKASPYLVEDAYDLIAIGKKTIGSSGLYFKQVANIDLSEYEDATQFPTIVLRSNSNSSNAIFEYNGAGYQLFNLTQSPINGDKNVDFGLFKCYCTSNTSSSTREDAYKYVFKNINMMNVDVSGSGGSPLLSPATSNSSIASSGYKCIFDITVENCFISGKMTGISIESCDISCLIPGKLLRYSTSHGVTLYPTVRNCTVVMQVTIISNSASKTTFGGAIGDGEFSTGGTYKLQVSSPLVINTAIHADVSVKNTASGTVSVAGLMNSSSAINLIRSYVNMSFNFINTGVGSINGYYFGKNTGYTGTCIANHEKGGLTKYTEDNLHFLNEEQMKDPSYFAQLGWWI